VHLRGPRILEYCQFATAHMASRAVNMDWERVM
jgi:hypothetical protein